MTKSQTRKLIKESIQQNKTQLPQLSAAVCQKILALDEYNKASVIFAYIPIEDEVNILPVIEDALKRGKKVAVPKITPETNKMVFYYLSDYSNLNNELVCGSYNIKEPLETLPAADINTVNENVMIFTPGRAFTTSGLRLGRGKGFYDIHFESVAGKDNVFFLGICFPFQIVEELEINQNDIVMHKVLC